MKDPNTDYIAARHLNFVSNNWNDFEGFLKEDLSKICFLENFNIDLRIIEMEWELILCDFQVKFLKYLFAIHIIFSRKSPNKRQPYSKYTTFMRGI